jgi:hypothetical protein
MGKKINTPLRRLLLFCVSLCGAGMLMLLFATLLNGRETAVVYAQTLPEVYINASNTTVSEGVGTAQVQVNISEAPAFTVTVEYFTLNGSATAGTSGDYIAVTNGLLTFPVGATASQPLTVTINDDSVSESSETINIVLRNPVSATLRTNQTAGTITITDNDPTPTPTPSGGPPLFADGLEPNNEFGTAYEITADAGSVCDLTFYPPGDDDYFRWWGKEGITYVVSIPDLDAGLDTVIEVFSSNFNMIGSNDDQAAGDFRSRVSVTLNNDGYFYARAYNKTPTDPVNKRYCLEVTSTVLPTSTPFPTPPPISAEADDCEYNSTIETACLLIANDTSLGTMNFVPSLGSTRDTDIYKMWVKPGISYECETTIPSGSAADTNMIIWNSAGNPFDPWIGNDDKVPGGLDFGSLVQFTPNYTGWVFVVVGPVNEPPFEEASLHSYNLSCTADDATPTPTPTNTSVPSSSGSSGSGGTFATPTPFDIATLIPTPFPTPTPIDLSQFYTPTPAPPPLVQFQPLPTATSGAPSQQPGNVNVTVYYDSNDNFTPELTEGVMNTAVALYDNGTGQLISFGQTNDAGEARFPDVTANGAIRVVVPFLNYTQILASGSSEEILIRIAPQILPIGIP